MVRDPRDTERDLDRRADYEFDRRDDFDLDRRSRDWGQRDYRRPSFTQNEYERSGSYPRDYGAGSFPQAWEGPFQGVGPRNYRRSDERIREDVSDRLSMHGGVDASDIDVEVVDCVVTLSGVVPERRMKRLAEDAADNVPGVRDVRNEIRVGDQPDTRRSGTMTPKTSARRTVFGIFTDADRAEDAVNELRDARFDRNDISVLARSERDARDVAGSTGAETKGVGTGAVLGGIAGGALGWLVGAGALAIPGVGPIIAVGALGTTIAGAAAGAVAGGFIGLLAGLGVPEEQAKTYEAAIKKGGILVTCGCDDDREVQRAREILQRHGANEIRDYDSREAQQRLEREQMDRGRTERERETASVR